MSKSKKMAVNKKAVNKKEFFGTLWTCMECNESYEHKAFIEHLKTVHKADCETQQIKASMRMTMHMDGSDWFSSNYEGEAIFPDGRKVKCLRYERTKRTGESAMYWGA